MENKKRINILLCVLGVLNIVELVMRIITVKSNTVSAIAQLASLIFVILYGLWLYKKPHGNMLKYAMLIFSFAGIISASYYLLNGIKAHTLTIIAAALICYCAGRLDRIEQNKYLLSFAGILLFITSIQVSCIVPSYEPGNFLLVISCFNFTINYITIMIAYFVRYKEHKEAGLTDK